MKKLFKYGSAFVLTFLILTVFSTGDLVAQITNGSDTNAKSGLRGAPRVYKFSARTIALGDATVADTYDLSLMNVNPASLSFVTNLNQTQMNVFQNWNNNIMYENFTSPGFRYRSHTVAGQLSFYHGGANFTNFLGRPPMPQPSLSMYQMDVAYAFSFENVLSLGVMTNVSFTDNDWGQYWSSHTTLGLIYAPSRSISYGIAFRGLGRSPLYHIINTEENTGLTILYTQDLREVLELGATLRFPVDTNNSYLALSLANEKRFGEEGIWYKAGLEVQKISFLALRAGLLFQPETNVYAPRFGFGVKTRYAEMDYAVSYQKKLYERFHQLAVIVPLQW